MAQYFQLVRKDDLESGPVAFSIIDEELCKFLGCGAHPVKYVAEWYDTIGLRLACGRSFDDIIEEFQRSLDSEKGYGSAEWYATILKIAKYLQEHYTSDAWYGR